MLSAQNERHHLGPKIRPNLSEELKVNGILFTFGDIFNVVDDFYKRVQRDPILKVPFQSVHDWPEHIERIAHFWWIRFGGKPYMFAEYNPVLKHFFAGFNSTFLSQWLKLFHETLKLHLNNDQTHFWTTVTERMGQSLSIRNEYFKEHYEKNNHD